MSIGIDSACGASNRTAVDRQAELSAILEKRITVYMRAHMTEAVKASYEKSPQGPHSDEVRRVLRALNRLPIPGKEVVFSLGPDGPWGVARIGLTPPRSFVRLPETFLTYDEAFRAIFAARWARRMSANP